MGVQASRVRVREMSSRWGSCSAAGSLCFNLRLLAAPVELIDYVVVHELAHLREMNHSRRFWAEVAKTLPDFKSRRSRLRALERELLDRDDAVMPLVELGALARIPAS